MKKVLSGFLLSILLLFYTVMAISQSCLVPPNGAVVKTTSYPIANGDFGKLIVMNCTLPCTVTLPAKIQATTYFVSITSIGSAPVTVSPNGRLLNNSAASINVPLGKGHGFTIQTDGANYFTSGLQLDTKIWDITAFGAVALNVGTTPYLPGITATPTAGNTTLPISSASSFVNGEGVAVWNTGATNTMTTPNAPVVTCVLAAAPTGSGYTVPCAPGGTEITCYKIIATDKGRGYTAASTEACVTGQTRGVVQTNLSSCVRSAYTLVTCTTSAPHTLAVGAWIRVGGTTLDIEYAGYHKVTTVSGNNFTYQWSKDSRAGASTVKATGGFVRYWQGNEVVIEGKAPPANVFQYGIFRGASNAETFADVSMIVTPAVNLDSSYMVWDDFGTTYTTVPTGRPSFWPTNPPTTAVNDEFITTICSGAGTTTLTLCDAPINTPPGPVTIVADNTHNYLDALTFAQANRGIVSTPTSPLGWFYATNSILDISPFGSVGFVLNGGYFGDTLVIGGRNLVVGTPAFLTNTQFDIEPLTDITFQAKPGIYTRGGTFRGLAFNPIGTNTQGVFIASGGIPTGTFDDVAFFGASAAGDYGSIPLYIFAQGQAGSAAAGITFRNVATKGQAQGITPVILSKNYGEISFDGLMGAGRGYFFSNCPTCTGTGITINQRFEQQAASMPIITTRGTVWLGAGGIIEDTGSEPIVAHVGGGPLNLSIGASLPSSGMPQVTGNEIESVSGAGITLTQQGVNINTTGDLTSFMYDGSYSWVGQNSGYQSLHTENRHFAIGSGYSFFTAPASYAAPTCTVTTAGPPYSMSTYGGGTYTFAYTPMYPNGGQGVPSPYVTCTMNGTTQQATINIPAPVPGAIGYYLLFGTNGGLGSYYTIVQYTLSILVPSGPQYLHGQSQPVIAGGGPAGMRGDTVWGNTITLGSTLFSALGAAANGTFVYCPNCTVANPCASGGTGALAKRLNGIWVCN